MLELRVFGSLDLRDDEGRQAERVLSQPKRMAVLVYLAAAVPAGFHSRDEVLALLWPDSDRRRARGSLRKALHFLRRQVGPDLIRTRGSDLALADSRVWCDVRAFEEARASGDLRGALGLYQGDFLPGFHVSGAPELDQWVSRTRDRLRSAAVQGAWSLAQAEEEVGDGFEAAHWARIAVSRAPYDEAGVYRLMDLLHRLGDRAGALRTFEEAERRLRQELDVEPSTEIVELWRRIRRGGPTDPPLSNRRADPNASTLPADSVAEADTTHPLSTATATTFESRRAPLRGRWRPFLGSLFLGGVLVGGVLAFPWLGLRVTDETASATGAAVPLAVAVFPLENRLSPAEDRSWLVTGIQEQIIYRLSGVRDVRVIAPTSVAAYGGREVELRTIAEELGADVILRGGVRGDERRIRVSVRLIDGATGHTEWTREYRGIGQDALLEGQTRIAAEVALALAGDGRSESGFDALRGSTDAPDAMEAYLRGRYLWKKLGAPPGARAVDSFRRAVEIDPDFSLAWAALAEGWLASAHFGTDPHLAFPRADSAALQALIRRPDLAEGHVALADTRFHYDWNWDAAEREFQLGLALNPSHATAHWWYAGLLAARARREEAIEQMNRAKALDPLAPIVHAFEARVLYWLRRFDDAERAARRALELAPDHFYALGVLGFVHLQRNEPEDAIDAFHRSVALSPKFLPGLAMALTRAGREDEARTVVARLETTARGGYVSSYEHAFAFLGTGDRERVLQMLERAVEARDAELIWIGADPAWDAIRDEPRFQEILRQIGLSG